VPSASTLAQRVHTALAALQNPRNGQDVVAAGMVRDLVVDDAGAVSFTFALTRDDPATLAREARRAVQAVAGVTGVRVNVTDPSATPRAPARGAAPGGPGPSVPPPPTPVAMPHLGKALAVSSGKGGVGKSTVSANLAVALARAGHRVGLMDADIYGPNIPRMLGVDKKPEVVGGKIQPLESHGVKLKLRKSVCSAVLSSRTLPLLFQGELLAEGTCPLYDSVLVGASCPPLAVLMLISGDVAISGGTVAGYRRVPREGRRTPFLAGAFPVTRLGRLEREFHFDKAQQGLIGSSIACFTARFRPG